MLLSFSIAVSSASLAAAAITALTTQLATPSSASTFLTTPALSVAVSAIQEAPTSTAPSSTSSPATSTPTSPSPPNVLNDSGDPSALTGNGSDGTNLVIIIGGVGVAAIIAAAGICRLVGSRQRTSALVTSTKGAGAVVDSAGVTWTSEGPPSPATSPKIADLVMPAANKPEPPTPPLSSPGTLSPESAPSASAADTNEYTPTSYEQGAAAAADDAVPLENVFHSVDEMKL